MTMKPSLIPSPVPPTSESRGGGFRPSIPPSAREMQTTKSAATIPSAAMLRPLHLAPSLPQPPAPTPVPSFSPLLLKPSAAPESKTSLTPSSLPSLTRPAAARPDFVPSLGSTLNKDHYALVLRQEGCDMETIAFAKIILEKHGDNILAYGDVASDDLLDIQNRLLVTTDRISEQTVQAIISEITPNLWKRLNTSHSKEAVHERVSRVQHLLGSLEPVPATYRALDETLSKILRHASRAVATAFSLIDAIERKEKDPLILQQCALRKDGLETIRSRIAITTEQVRQIGVYAVISAKTLTTIKTAVADWMQKINSEAMPNGAACVAQIKEAMRALHE